MVPVTRRGGLPAAPTPCLRAGVDQEVDHPVGVAPLVVVPAEHLDELAHAHREPGVEDARVRVVDDVAGHDRVLGVADDSLQRAADGRPWRRPR